MYSLIIKNAKVIDGTGKPSRVDLLDLAVEKDQIVNIDKNITSKAQTVIDAEGKVLAPGFVDIQNHSDSYWQIFDNPSLGSLVSQGYTTILVGHCGASLAPLLSSQSLLAMQKWHTLEGANLNWQSFSEFVSALSKRNYGTNIASLVGYATLRRGILGDQVRSLEPAEMESLKKILDESLKNGAFGLSTGLSYAHEIIISQLELFELAKVVSRHNALFSVHLRSESGEAVESVEEVLEIAKSANLNLKISHLKVRGQKNWEKTGQILELLETAYHRGIKVHFDAYPYDTVWQALYSYLPKWAIEGGRSLLLKHLADPTQKNKILSYLNSLEVKWPEMIVASTGSRLQFTGKTLGQIAKNLECSSEAAVLHLIEHAGSEVLVFEKSLKSENVDDFVYHPLCFIATDGGGFKTGEKSRLVHPRCFGTAAKFLKGSLFSKRINLETAVQKLSSGPARKMGLNDRGEIKIGNKADLVIFNPEKISDTATYENPGQLSQGIEHVFVNGTHALANGKLTEALGGRVLKK